MLKQVNATPSLPQGFQEINVFAFSSLVQALIREMVDYAYRLNKVLPEDGSEAMAGPLPLAQYAKASLPTAASYNGAMIFVTDDVGGSTPAFSDGTNWRRVADRNIIS